MSSNLYQEGLKRIMDGSCLLLTDTIKVIALGTGYTPNKDHQFVSDVVANEISGTGYTGGFAGSGRKTLASKAVAKSDSTDKAYFDAADVAYSAINAGTIGGLAVYKNGTSDSDSPLLAFVDVANITTDGGDVTIAWSANGIFDWAA